MFIFDFLLSNFLNRRLCLLLLLCLLLGCRIGRSGHGGEEETFKVSHGAGLEGVFAHLFGEFGKG